MVFIGATYTNCKGPKLDASRSQTVTYANCQYDIIRQHKWFFKGKIDMHYEI
jgi:hypothetical protein